MKNLTNKDIIVEINKMKEIRRLFSSKSDENRNYYSELAKRITNTINKIVITSLISILLFVATGWIWFMLTNFLVSYVAIKSLNRLKEKSNTIAVDSITTRDKVNDAIDLFIDNNEAILENRQGKEISSDRIKNLNICFLVDERYNYDLKKINEKYNFDAENLDLDVNSILTAEEFCEIVEPIIGSNDDLKIKSKALMYLKYN